ncbi:hypothetical protein EPYR_00498 [Erwinia pyrifoliae DSM 12163]|nr:hypothetical protein EPYR_00498 [Erwinia pyrifoliae DSM 12163]
MPYLSQLSGRLLAGKSLAGATKMIKREGARRANAFAA